MKKLLYTIIGLLGLSSFFATTSCIDNDPVGDSYYTFTGEMVTDYLTNREMKNPGTFSDFIEVLHRANLWDLLSTYGTFTCFAPTNEAINRYMKQRGYKTVSDISDAECDTLAWTHLFKIAYFTTDLGDGQLPTTNMNDRYVTLTCDTVNGNVKYHINSSEMIARDDSVENGVVHVINNVITSSSILLAELVCNDPQLTIFGEALALTGLNKMIDGKIEDETYVIHPDSTIAAKDHTKKFGGDIPVFWRYPAKREFHYTIFAETDSIFKQHNIKDIKDLIKHAEDVYHKAYPNDLGYDKDYTNRKNPLNRFIAYHILDRHATYDELTLSGANEWSKNARSQWVTEKIDIQEFYETCCPYTIMKVSDAAGDKYVNRRGYDGIGGSAPKDTRGARILTASESSALNIDYSDARNGAYYYVDNLIQYDDVTTDKVLNCRMRIDATTLSPDFMTAGARNIVRNSDDLAKGAQKLMMAFRPGFAKNFIFSDDTFFGVHERFWCNSYENDMCACLENFDIKFKLPPVPAGETYEVRIGYQSGGDRTVVQIYFDDNLTGDIPCGIPVDLRKFGGEYGYEFDADLGNDEDAIEANDKSMRNQGFMKGPAGYCHPGGGSTMRDNGYKQCLRRILTTKYFEEGHDYYIRLRQVLDNEAEMSLDYIEIVPKSVYNGTKAEDRY